MYVRQLFNLSIYGKDRELFKMLEKEWRKGEKPIIRNLLSKSPEFINNLLK